MFLKHVVDVVESTRHHPDLELGTSPRDGIALPETSRAPALISFLERLHHQLPDEKRTELVAEISKLQDRFFGPSGESLATEDLAEIATRWKQAA